MNKKELRRFRELTGQVVKNAIVTGLYENHYDPDAQGPLADLEGPFRMKNGRVVYYDPIEGKYYDRRTDMYLSDEEAAALHEETQYKADVVLHAKKGDKKLSLHLESMGSIKPMAMILRNNGFDDIEFNDGESEEPVNLDIDDENDDENIVDKLVRVQHDVEHLKTMLDNGEISEEDVESLAAHLDMISDVHSQFMGDDEQPEPVDVDDSENGQITERKLTADEKEKLERLKDKHDKDGSMKASMKKQYGDSWEDVYYGKLTKMAKENAEDEFLTSLNKKQVVTLSRRGHSPEAISDMVGAPADVVRSYLQKVGELGFNDAAQEGSKRADLVEYAKGDKVMHNGKEMYIVVPNGKGDMIGISDNLKGGKVNMVKPDELSTVKNDGKLKEAAVSATVYDNDAMPADSVDDMEQKAERTGQADRTETKNVVPKEVMASIDKRISEIKKSIERYDHTGYNDNSVKVNAVECLEQIKKNLGRGDLEGFMEAQVFFGTLMSPIWDLFPAQLVNYLAKGDDSDNPDAA